MASVFTVYLLAIVNCILATTWAVSIATANSQPARGPQRVIDWNPLAKCGIETARSRIASPQGAAVALTYSTLSALGSRQPGRLLRSLLK